MKEIEVKVVLKDFKEIKKKLKELGAEKKCPKTFEKNILFGHKKLKFEKDWILRLRKFGKKNILTLKTSAKGKKGFKVREEINILVEDFENMKNILEKIGFFEAFYYEKYREDYIYNGLNISLDKTPIGNYVEIEGDYKNILKFLKKINVKIEETISLSYIQLFQMFNKKSNKMAFT